MRCGFLYVSERHPSVECSGDEGVSERVGADPLLDARSAGQPSDHSCDVVTVHPLPVAVSPDHSRDVWLVGVDGWFGLWCGVGWLIGVCRGSGGAGGLVRGAWGRGCSTAGVRDWSGAPVR